VFSLLKFLGEPDTERTNLSKFANKGCLSLLAPILHSLSGRPIVRTQRNGADSPLARTLRTLAQSRQAGRVSGSFRALARQRPRNKEFAGPCNCSRRQTMTHFSKSSRAADPSGLRSHDRSVKSSSFASFRRLSWRVVGFCDHRRAASEIPLPPPCECNTLPEPSQLCDNEAKTRHRNVRPHPPAFDHRVIIKFIR
jgi:hypothetical protein